MIYDAILQRTKYKEFSKELQKNVKKINYSKRMQSKFNLVFERGPKVKKIHCPSIFATFMVLVFVISFLLPGCGTESTPPGQTKNQTQGQTQKYTEVATKQATTQPRANEAETDPYVGNKTTFTGLGLGDIAKVEDYYVALHYVKRMSYLPTVLDEEAASPGCDVIIAFFEFFNGSNDIISIDPMDLTGYVDGTLASQVETSVNTYVDGVGQFYGAKLDPGCRLMSCQDIEVKDGWKEIKFFYNADCVWTLTPQDIQEDNYVATSFFETLNIDAVTSVGTKMISDGYSIEYQGYKKTHIDDSWSSGNFVVFFFRVTNNSSANLSTGSWGYSMRAYQDGLLLGAPRRLHDKKIDDYIDFCDIDEIAPRMSANIYIAFDYEVKGDAEWVMIYDDGYITPHYCGTIIVNDRKDTSEEEHSTEPVNTSAKEEIHKEQVVALDNASVGDIIHFGFYEQDGNESNGTEEVEWIVLDINDDGAMIISKDILDVGKYNAQDSETTWEGCSLREWLNVYFYNTAFDISHKSIIEETLVMPDRNQSYWNTPPGNITMDNVFVLSLSEVETFFETDDLRQCPTSKVATEAKNWWLRTPGENTKLVTVVTTEDGSISNQGVSVVNDYVGIRPVMRIAPDSFIVDSSQMNENCIGIYVLQLSRDEDGLHSYDKYDEAATIMLDEDGNAEINIATVEEPYLYQYSITNNEITLTSNSETIPGKIFLGINGVISLQIDDVTTLEFIRTE